ncbi:hypothetical protein [Salegentibacter sp. F14]
MKKLIVTILIVFSLQIVLGQNGLQGGKYFMLLNSRETVSINTFENNKIKDHKIFPINEKSIYATDQNKRVAILDTAANNVSLYNIQTSNEIKLKIPFDIKPKTILLNDDNLFIGGEMGKEMLVQYHLQREKWYELEIPLDVLFIGKAIDDLVVNDSLLIAIDNIVMPKYVVYYHLNSKEELKLSHYKELKSNGAYENIYQARITNKYFGLLSSTFSGYVGASNHITIYDSMNLESSFAISSNEQEKYSHTFTDFVIVKDQIIIASKEKGLGIFKIKSSYFKKTDRDNDRVFNFRIRSSKIRFSDYDNEKIRKITTIPNTENIVLTLENEIGIIRQEIKRM